MNALSYAPDVAPDQAPDTAKRRQIVAGARGVFLAQGFEGASMNDIARAAGVSKGTLYVYFENKERLFAEIVDQERQAHIHAIYELDDRESDVAAVLTRVGIELATFLATPRIVSAMRAIMGIAERLPELGREFYTSGPSCGRRRLAAYFDARVAAGQLVIPDTALAAAQFLELVHGPLVKPMFFGCEREVTPERIQAVVASGVHMFLCAYAVESPRSA